LAKTHRDFPKGRKRARWKAEFLEALGKPAVDLGNIGHEVILQAVKRRRKARLSEPDTTVVFGRKDRNVDDFRYARLLVASEAA
jgi:hypothetical protein